MMKVHIHETIMLDGRTAIDVDILPNTAKGFVPRHISTFETVNDARAFAKDLASLMLKHTCMEVDVHES